MLVFADGAGVKAVRIEDLPDSAWTWYSPHSSKDANAESYYKAVGWLYRAVTLRAQALSAMPFALVDANGDDYDISATWENKCGFLSSPKTLLWLVESALCLTAQAYLYRLTNKAGNQLLGLRYLLPSSIAPMFDIERGLVGFKRSLGTTTIELEPSDLVYFWLPDPWVEIGPGTPPAAAAMAPAGVLYNKDRFVANFFARGMIKAMIIRVAGATSEPERSRLKDWLKRIFSGIDKSWTSEVVNAEKLEPVMLGEGLESLSNSTLTAEAREEVATALGIPQTLLFSNAANYATAKEDRLHFYTETVVPEAGFVADVLNHQVFEPQGLRFEFRPETMDIYQEDEAARAGSFKLYVDAGMRASVAAQIVGIELPQGVEYDDLDPGGDEGPEPEPAEGVEAETDEEPAELRADLARWQRVALRRLSEGKALDYHFESEAVPAARHAAILAALAAATTEAEVKAAFKEGAGMKPPDPFCGEARCWHGYP